MKNKKAQVFATGLVIITLIMMGIALFVFLSVDSKIKEGVNPPVEILDSYTEKTAFAFYAKESAAFASANAFSALAKEITSGECTVVQMNYILWNDTCKPNTDEIKKKFMNKFNNSLVLSIKNYPSHLKNTSFVPSLQESDKIKLASDNIVLNASNNKGYVRYNSTFTFNPSFEFNLQDININLSDFENIYSIALQCKDKNRTKVENCLANKFERWDFSLSSYDKYLLSDFKTKKNYFLNGKISEVALKFALEI